MKKQNLQKIILIIGVFLLAFTIYQHYLNYKTTLNKTNNQEEYSGIIGKQFPIHIIDSTFQTNKLKLLLLFQSSMCKTCISSSILFINDFYSSSKNTNKRVYIIEITESNDMTNFLLYRKLCLFKESMFQITQNYVPTEFINLKDPIFIVLDNNNYVIKTIDVDNPTSSKEIESFM